MVCSRHMGKIALGAAVLAAALVLLLGLAGKAGAVLPAGENPGYVSRLFDGSRVHRVDIQVEDWEAFLASAPEEEYIPATVEIDGEAFRQVGLRAKGNNSLRLTAEYGLSRYSLKLEFDHYTDGSYHGLDKLSLDASFQDNSYLKTWLAFDIMEFLGVPTPLRSFVWVTVNGQPWGLFLAVEEPEEAFARRNFGANHGQLYKPDYRSLAEENAEVHLRYTTGEPEDYPGIFENAKLDPSAADRQRLVDSLKTLDSGQRLEEAVDVDEVLRYFVGQVFVMNWDSYLGHTGHNYLLYEEEGKLSMLPWDYNLAFGTYALGMTDPITDPNVLLNYPILTPAPGEHMTKRPLYHQLMQVEEYFQQYQAYFRWFLAEYVESGELSAALWQAAELIAPYVKADPTAFCSYEDHRLAVETLEQVCLLRAQSARGQLEGRYPATLAQQTQRPGEGVDASHVDLRHLGDFEDLKQAGTGRT